jgi:hypothetical protein
VGTTRQALHAALTTAAARGDLKDALQGLLAVTHECTVIVWALQRCQTELARDPRPIDRALLERAHQLLRSALATPPYSMPADHPLNRSG